MTGETPEVRSDKRKPRGKKKEKEREKRKTKEKKREERKGKKKKEEERKREKKREKERKREKKEKKRENDVQGQLLSICIQFSKRKTKYIGRNAQNLKKWVMDL